MPRIAVLATPDLVQDRTIRGAAAVIDVLRATSSITQAFSSGCARQIPAATEEEARSILAANPGAVISGERDGLRIKGFDLGNSPADYSRDRVGGKTVVMTTSNGTRAILGTAAAGASPVFICSFLNLDAVARAYLAAAARSLPADRGADLTVVCSGSRGAFSLEDFACAGALVSAILSLSPSAEFALEEGAKKAVERFAAFRGDALAVFNESEHGRYLASIGFQDDLTHCARIGALDVVPVFRDGAVAGSGIATNPFPFPGR